MFNSEALSEDGESGLLGRRAELAILVDRLRSNAGVAVVGEAGIGKTSLLRAAAKASGRQLHEAGGFATLSWLPYAPLGRLLGWPVPGGDEAQLADELEKVVGAGILFLDDLHWCDPATRALVPVLAGRLGLLIAVRQPAVAAEVVLDELAAAGVEVMTLAELPDDVGALLARRARPNLSAHQVSTVLSNAGGNPLLIEELASTGAPSTGLRRAVEAQLRDLGPEVRETFALVSILARPVPAHLLSGRQLELARTGLVRIVDGLVEVRHTILAEVTVAGLSAAHSRRLHEQAARILDNPGERARHLLAAGHRRLARDLALEAAAEAVHPAERASHLGLAAECSFGPNADGLRLDAAAALSETGQNAAASTLLNAVKSRDPVIRARVLLQRTLVDWERGDGASAGAALAEAVTLVEGTGSEIEIDLRLAQARVAAFVDGAYERAVDFASTALALARGRGTSTARAHYLLGTSLTLHGAGGWAEHLSAAIAEALAEGDHDVEMRAANNFIGAHEMDGSPAQAAATARQMADRAGRLGLAAWERQFLAMRANLDMLAGDYEASIATADLLLEQALERRTRDQIEVTRCHALIDLGLFEEATEQINRSLRSAAPDAIGRHQFLYLAAEIHIWTGRYRTAIDELDDLLASIHGDFEIGVFARVGRARACLALGLDPGPFELPHPISFFAAAPIEVAASRDLIDGHDVAAAALFDQSATAWGPYHFRNSLYCRLQAAEALLRGGRSEEAIRRLAEVERIAADHWMLPLHAQARRMLRRAGQRPVTPRAPSSGGLTGREQQVLSLIRHGVTNAEIAARLGVSRRTVETQIASAAAKLGARTRGQAAALSEAP